MLMATPVLLRKVKRKDDRIEKSNATQDKWLSDSLSIHLASVIQPAIEGQSLVYTVCWQSYNINMNLTGSNIEMPHI